MPVPPKRTTVPLLQVPALHFEVPVHAMHALPPVPHALCAVPGRHCPIEQQPLAHDVASQVHAPATHAWPPGHEPLLHVPPHPSLAPHALPVQLGVHPHTPGVPPPPHVSGEAHAFPAQHGCPLPPHAPQLEVPHVCPPPHETQTVPPMPHALLLVPGSHVVPEQHPPHDVASQTHTPVTQCSPVEHVPAPHTPPHPSPAPHALPVQLGVHPHTPGMPAPPHVSGEAQAFAAQHGCPLPPHAPQLEVPHVCPLPHTTQTVPPMPHSLLLVPDSHVVPEQQPAHDVASQTHTPVTQRSPVEHIPAVHTPPHPSPAPHALPVQLGVHPHTPGVPPPPHVSGAPHVFPAQHACSLPPQVPHPAVPQATPLGDAEHTAPPLPHALSAMPGSHDEPLQHPPQDVLSHLHTPATHRCPCPQLPWVHTPEQPSLAPQALLAQLGWHFPVPHTLGVPPPPQFWGIVHPPQSTSLWHESRSSPHLPWHAAISLAMQPSPAASAPGLTSPPTSAVASCPPSSEAAGRSKLAPRSDEHPGARTTASPTTTASAAYSRRFCRHHTTRRALMPTGSPWSGSPPSPCRPCTLDPPLKPLRHQRGPCQARCPLLTDPQLRTDAARGPRSHETSQKRSTDKIPAGSRRRKSPAMARRQCNS